MSQPILSSAPVFGAEPNAVFLPVSGKEVFCYWCRKVLQACDGKRTLAEVGELLHLPFAVCRKLMDRALHKGWAEARAEQVSLWTQMLTALGDGEDGEALLRQAAQMSRCQPGQIPTQEVGHFLIALELLLPEAQRVGVIPTLDRLREQYACATRKR